VTPALSESGREPYDILLVEDQESTRGLLRSMLEQDGLRVRSCDGESGALEQIAVTAPDAVLAGSASGPSLLAQLRRQPVLAGLPVLLLSEDDDDLARYRLVARGADEVLSLPLAPDVLAASVRARILRSRLLGARLPGVAEPAHRSGQLRRGEFLAQLGAALRKGVAPWQVLVAVRVDQAKSLLETLGQAAAFELEQAIAMRFAAALREDDAQTLWMEFGFGVLAQRESREEIEALAQDICARVASAAFEVRGKSQSLTVSVGVALAPAGADAGDPDRWFASAHAAQAIAHRLGGNRFDGVLSREHGDLPPERVLIIREWVKEAIAGENVLIEFQPVLPLRSELAGLYCLDARLRDYRAPLAGVRRREYLSLARSAGALPMIDRMSLFSAFEAIEQERERGRSTRVLVPMDLATVNDAQLVWLDAELRRRKAGSDGLIIEFDADMALGRPELVRVVQRLEDHGIVIAISDASGDLGRIGKLQRFPAGLLRLPLAAIDSVSAKGFLDLLGPWRASGRGLIADQVQDVSAVSRLFDLQVGYVQGDRLAAGGPRLDYEFGQIGG
jgi:GGDEF domain-containing protein/EAL domain-containing protein (putative c-di-GMP-specific phosphodiesterase class I)